MRERAHSTKNANSSTSQKRAHFASAFEVLDRMGCRAQSRNHEAISFGNDLNIYIYIYIYIEFASRRVGDQCGIESVSARPYTIGQRPGRSWRPSLAVSFVAEACLIQVSSVDFIICRSERVVGHLLHATLSPRLVSSSLSIPCMPTQPQRTPSSL